MKKTDLHKFYFLYHVEKPGLTLMKEENSFYSEMFTKNLICLFFGENKNQLFHQNFYSENNFYVRYLL